MLETKVKPSGKVHMDWQVPRDRGKGSMCFVSHAVSLRTYMIIFIANDLVKKLRAI